MDEQPAAERVEARVGRLGLVCGHPVARVGDLDEELVVIAAGTHCHLQRLIVGVASVLERVFHERLDHGGQHRNAADGGVAVDPAGELVAEPERLDREVILEGVHLPAERLERGDGAEEKPQILRQRLRDHLDVSGRLLAGEDRVQRIEEKVRADLGLQVVELVAGGEGFGLEGAQFRCPLVAEQVGAEVGRRPCAEQDHIEEKPGGEAEPVGSAGGGVDRQRRASRERAVDHERENHHDRAGQRPPHRQPDLGNPQPLEQRRALGGHPHGCRDQAGRHHPHADEPRCVRQGRLERPDHDHRASERGQPKTGVGDPERLA